MVSFGAESQYETSPWYFVWVCNFFGTTVGAIVSAHGKASPLKGVSYWDGVAKMPMAAVQLEAGLRTAVPRSSLAMMR